MRSERRTAVAPPRCSTCAVRDSALCSALDDGDLARIHAIGLRRTVAAEQVLVWTGDRNAICANLVSGVLKVVRAGPDRQDHIVGLLFPGDFVGELFADSASDTVQVLCDADLCIYPRAALRHVLDDHPAAERLLLRRALATLNDARKWMLILSRKTARAKVATFLIDMARRLDDAGAAAGKFDLPMSRSEIGAVLGLTIETVSRQVTALRVAGIIALPGGRSVVIRDHARLAGRAAA
ncbi:Crp/Fnr family transcriptional regulator [Sphingomonas montana]|uniref:Crp/Fnr family transcriptional regulator n=1 Tax=Sphingomonas montana TaxID=1843236 RepID=UPI00096FE4F3|nr:Crp/Fnr family transcriptional regulator [Sphingomonas montana]